MMRDHVRGDWNGFHPKTNVFWLHYLADKLVNGEVVYKMTKTTKHRKAISVLRGIKERVLQYSSAVEYVLSEGQRTD